MFSEGNLHELKNPLITHKLTKMRRKETSSKNFRELVEEIAMLMAYEVSKDFSMQEVEIETPLMKFKTKTLDEENFIIVPILRAGLAMANGVSKILPDAQVRHIGLYRDEKTHQPVEYYNNIASDNGKGPVRLRKRKNGKNKEQQFNFDVSKYKMGANCILLDRF